MPVVTPVGTSPHEANHGVQVYDSSLVSSEDLSPGTLVRREPGAELLYQFIAAAGVEDLWVVPAQGQGKEHEGNTREQAGRTLSLTALN